MSLDALVPANTHKARATARNAFLRFLKADGVDEQLVHDGIAQDATGARLITVIDRFGLHLAFSEGKSGKPLSTNSVMSYSGQVKNWLIDRHCHLRALVESPILKKGKTLESFCMKRESGDYVHKAPACTKDDLKCIMHYQYANAGSAVDYQDAALVCLMWHSFGRASDLGFVQKQHLSVSATGEFFMRLLRIKTSQEQGLTLVPDKDKFLTCPLFALAAALVVQEAPSTALLNQLPDLRAPQVVIADPTVPLVDLLGADPGKNSATRSPAEAPVAKHSRIGIHGYVNRLLRRVSMPKHATQDLTSHSFRRGGAQHANGDDRLAPQWIFDCGTWSLSSMNKGFAYVFNTPREDRKVARVISGWEVDSSPRILDISTLDHAAQEQLRRLQVTLFGSCIGLSDARLNVSSKVLDVLTAYLVRYFAQAKALNAASPLVARVESCAAEVQIPLVELVAWSVALEDKQQAGTTVNATDEDQAKLMCCAKRRDAVIQELIELNRRQGERLRVVEAALLGKRAAASQDLHTEPPDARKVSVSAKTPKRRKAAPTHLSDVCFAWYAGSPRGWDVADKNKRSESRMLVAYMKLFLERDFDLRKNEPGHKDRVVELGRTAEAAVLGFLSSRGMRAKSSGSVLRALRGLREAGVLNERISTYKVLLQTEAIHDPSPVSSHDVLQLSRM